MAFKRSASITLPQAMVDAVLGALTVAPADPLLDTPLIGLFQEPLSPGPAIDIAEYIAAEADFSGYARAAFDAPIGPVNFPASRRGIHQEVNFETDGEPPPGQTVYGWFCFRADPATLFGAESFAEPVTFMLDGDALSLDVAFVQAPNWPTGLAQ